MERYLKTIVIVEQAGARVIPSQQLVLISRAALEGLSVELLAGQVVFLMTYARVLRRVYESEQNKKRIECVCRHAELAFLEHVPGTIDIRIRLAEEASMDGCGDPHR